MRKILFILVSICCIYSTSVANNPYAKELNKSDANIIGHVLDKATKEHLPYITVTLKGTTIGTQTDATGHYFLKNLPEGKFTIEVSAVGYKSQSREVVLKKGKTIEADFEIEEDAIALDGVVISANRNETKRKFAPTLVNVLDVKMLEKTQSTDISQGLKFQPGVRVETNCQNCGFTQVRINGLEGPYSQILIDSRPVFSALAGVYGLEQIPANMIERVEVMRGGGSALFGSSAIAGTINIITKEPLVNSGSISHQIRGLGGLGKFENTTNFNGSIVSDNARMGASFFGQARHRSGYDKDGDGFTEIPLLDGRTLGFSSYIKPTAYSKLTAEFHNTHEFRRGGDRLNQEPHNALVAEQLEHTNNLGSLSYKLFSPDGKNTLSAYASFMKVNRKSYYGGGDKGFNEMVDDIAGNADDIKTRMASYGRTNGLTYMLGAQYNRNIDKFLFMPAQLTVGAEFNKDIIDDISGYRSAAIYQRVNTKSAFLQNEWKNDYISLLIGARLDKHSMVKNVIISPRANIRYNPYKDLTLRVSYSKGFRAPQLFDEDLHVDNAGGELIISQNAPNLKEETSHSYSGSVDWYKLLGAWQVNIMAEGFYTKLVDAFSTTTKEVTVGSDTHKVKIRENSSGAAVYGSNLEARIAYLNMFSLQGGLTIQRSLYDEETQWNEDDAYKTRRLYRTPDVYSYFIATLNPTKRLSLSLSGTYTGSMLVGHEIPTEDDGSLSQFNGAPSATIKADRLMHGEGQTATTYGPRTFKSPSFFELGLKANYALPLYKTYTLDLFAGVQNIFNAYQDDFDKGQMRDSAYIYGPSSPRSFFMGAKLSF